MFVAVGRAPPGPVLSGFGRPSETKMITCWTVRPKAVVRPWVVMSAAPAAMPCLRGVSPLATSPSIALPTVLALELPRARFVVAEPLPNDESPTRWRPEPPTPPSPSRVVTRAWAAALA